MAAGPIIESTPIGAAFQRFGLSKLLIPAGIVTVGTVLVVFLFEFLKAVVTVHAHHCGGRLSSLRSSDTYIVYTFGLLDLCIQNK